MKEKFNMNKVLEYEQLLLEEKEAKRKALEEEKERLKEHSRKMKKLHENHNKLVKTGAKDFVTLMEDSKAKVDTIWRKLPTLAKYKIDAPDKKRVRTITEVYIQAEFIAEGWITKGPVQLFITKSGEILNYVSIRSIEYKDIIHLQKNEILKGTEFSMKDEKLKNDELSLKYNIVLKDIPSFQVNENINDPETFKNESKKILDTFYKSLINTYRSETLST